MNNEPVAWAIKSDGDWTEIGFDDEILYEVEEWYTAQGWKYEYVPLYTHPAKTLTNEEMLECAEGAGCVFDYSYKGEVTFISKNSFKRFVEAILRKAQEKCLEKATQQ